MFINTISKSTQKNLDILRDRNVFRDFYLAGGTGTAIQLGHRFSYDLDFFADKDFDTGAMKNRFSRISKYFVIKEEKNTLIVDFKNTKISFFSYPYPVLFPFIVQFGVHIADIRDIACMKIDTVSSRGAKRDFIDLFFVCKKYRFEIILKLFKKKYKNIKYNLMHILKSLTYFNDAEEEPMPKMLENVSWKEIKGFFVSEAKKIVEISI